MKIRSVTCFYNPKSRHPDLDLQQVGALAKEAVQRFQTRGFEVQTTRLATTPFPLFLDPTKPAEAIQIASDMESDASQQGFNYLSFGPALPDSLQSYALVPQILAATNNIFFGGIMATAKEGVSIPAVKACARIIHQAATIKPNGFANLNFAALANVKPFGPFFPAAYQKGSQPGFSLAIECADVALVNFSRAINLETARASLLKTLQDYGRVLSGIAEELAHKYNAVFHGIDYSLAPFPQAWCSLGSALERLGPQKLGLFGSLAAAAFIADTLDRGTWPRAGFNGLMLPVLEDSTLAERTSQGILTIKDLLLYSAVCGTGLDTVPLPGDATEEQLAALLLDVAVLSIRLGKPLTARLMPIPGKSAGDPTDFHFDYFANGSVMSLPASALIGSLAEDQTFTLYPRH